VNSTPRLPSASLSTTAKSCHPERSLARSEANRQSQSKDPVRAGSTTGNEESFHIVIRFSDDGEDDCEAEPYHETSREAAIECSPRRKPWVESGT
jgi:hypothetical protein